MNEKKLAVTQNYDKYEELYMVTCYIEDHTDMIGTDLWQLYSDLKAALTWVWLCENNAKFEYIDSVIHDIIGKPDEYEKLAKSITKHDTSCKRELKIKYKKDGHEIEQRFVLEVIK